MTSDNRLFDDMARMAGGAMSSFAALREELEARFRDQAERLLAKADLVRRDELEAVHAMAEAARAENAALAERLAALEARVAAAGKPAAAKRRRKPAAGKD